jgi:SET domain-containing protein
MLEPSKKIYLGDSKIPGAGRGVFALTDIAANETIEVCPIIVVSDEDGLKLKETELQNYYFKSDDGKGNINFGICLGYGSLYNHSYEPNATYIKEFEDSIIEFMAIRPIRKDEEITVNYHNGNPNDKSPLWIKSIKPYRP